jgi:hypothetical protein
MERVILKNGKLSQKTTRLREACIGCHKFIKIPKRVKWLFYCECGLRLTFSGYTNYNQYLIHAKACPVRKDDNEYKTI